MPWEKIPSSVLSSLEATISVFIAWKFLLGRIGCGPSFDWVIEALLFSELNKLWAFRILRYKVSTEENIPLHCSFSAEIEIKPPLFLPFLKHLLYKHTPPAPPKPPLTLHPRNWRHRRKQHSFIQNMTWIEPVPLLCSFGCQHVSPTFLETAHRSDAVVGVLGPDVS